MGSRCFFLKFVDCQTHLRHECEVVGYNKLTLYWFDSSYVPFFKKVALRIIGLNGFWFKKISYCDGPIVVII